MTFLEHLEELRWTIIWILVATAIGAAVAWHFSDQVIEILSQDLASILADVVTGQDQQNLHVFEVAEAFTTRLKITLLLGFLIALPFNIFKIWEFVSPGLFVRERKVTAPLISLSTALFYCGVAFAYFVMIKLTVAFLFKLKPPSIVATMRMGSYVSFVIKFCITFGLVFQVPLVLALLSAIGLVSPRSIKAWWRYAVVIILILAAFLTPPDVLSQILMAVPILVLYWLGYGLAKIFGKGAQSFD